MRCLAYMTASKSGQNGLEDGIRKTAISSYKVARTKQKIKKDEPWKTHKNTTAQKQTLSLKSL